MSIDKYGRWHCERCGRFVLPSPVGEHYDTVDCGIPMGSCEDLEPPPEQHWCRDCSEILSKGQPTGSWYISPGWFILAMVRTAPSKLAQQVAKVNTGMKTLAETITEAGVQMKTIGQHPHFIGTTKARIKWRQLLLLAALVIIVIIVGAAMSRHAETKKLPSTQQEMQQE